MVCTVLKQFGTPCSPLSPLYWGAKFNTRRKIPPVNWPPSPPPLPIPFHWRRDTFFTILPHNTIFFGQHMNVMSLLNVWSAF